MAEEVKPKEPEVEDGPRLQISEKLMLKHARGPGRPRLELDEVLIFRLAMIHCPNEEIAVACGCSVDTLTRNFAEIMEKGREAGKMSLRRKMFSQAMGNGKGATVMQIWLSKQLLGMKDQSRTDFGVELPEVKLNYMLPPPQIQAQEIAGEEEILEHEKIPE